MDREQLSSRVAAIRAECAAVGRELALEGRAFTREEAFELAGELQGVVNAAEGAQGVAAAWGARVETTMTSSGPSGRVHPVGFVDAMAATEVSLAAGVTQGLAGRKAALGAALGSRFPGVGDLVLGGDVPVSSAHKVVDACAGLDIDACRRVDAELARRLAGLDPARVTSAARQVAFRIAAEQVEAQVRRNRRGRLVEVSPGDDGTTHWFAILPTATSAAAYAAMEQLAGEYRSLDDTLTVPESRADALGDLLLRNVSVSARVTLGVPVLTGQGPPSESPGEEAAPGRAARVPDWVDLPDDFTVVDHTTGAVSTLAELSDASRAALGRLSVPAEDDPAGGLPEAGSGQPPAQAVAWPGYAVSGCELPRLGWVPAATVAALVRTVPMEVARAVVDADTGTLLSATSAAYRPPEAMRDLVMIRDGTCRMWGCARPADRGDLDHTRPWPAGATTPANLVALCRRHHRMKQRGAWRPSLDPDGTLTWSSGTGRTRTTEPAHSVHHPPRPHGTVGDADGSDGVAEVSTPPF